MRATFSHLAFAATVATSTVAAPTPAAAQQPARTPVRLAAAHTTSRAEVRAVAVYRLLAYHASGIPSQVVISDSAGRLVASYRIRDDSRSYPMMVDVSGAGIVLQGETDSGTLTLFLYDPSTPAVGRADGHWWLGGQEGELRGRAAQGLTR